MVGAMGVLMGLHFWDTFKFLGLDYNINYVMYVTFIAIGLNLVFGITLIYQARNQMDAWSKFENIANNFENL